MLKNSKYQYGSTDTYLPVHLNFSELILKKLIAFHDRTIVNGETNGTTTYGAIAQQSMKLAIALTRLGVRKGQTVAVCSENRSEFWGATIGSICTGATLSTANLMYTKYEITHVANISKPSYIICSPLAFKMHEKTFRSLKYIKKIIVFGEERYSNTISFDELVSGPGVDWKQFQVADADPEDTLFVLYSSGTTGLPKGVMLTHLNALVTCSGPFLQSPVPTIYLTIVPWFHAMGLMATLMYFCYGSNIVYLPKFDIELYLKCIEKYQVTRLQLVPPVLMQLIRHACVNDLRSVQFIFCGAAPLKEDSLDAVSKTFPNARPVLQGYGMTEVTLGITRNLDESKVPKPSSVGRVVPGAVVKVLDLVTRKPVGVNQAGEICVKGGIVMRGYVGRDRREDFDEEGFFRTGDVGYYDQNGYFYIVDRLKELIKYKGYQVAPAEIEAALLQHGAVRAAGVVGVADARAGELPRAFVALQPGARASEQELQDFVAKRLSKQKWLRGGVQFVQDIPKNPSGKILRRQLRAMLRDKSKL